MFSCPSASIVVFNGSPTLFCVSFFVCFICTLLAPVQAERFIIISADSRYLEDQGTQLNTSRYPYRIEENINRTTTFHKLIFNLTPGDRETFEILWKREEICPLEQFRLFSVICFYLFIDFHV